MVFPSSRLTLWHKKSFRRRLLRDGHVGMTQMERRSIRAGVVGHQLRASGLGLKDGGLRLELTHLMPEKRTKPMGPVHRAPRYMGRMFHVKHATRLARRSACSHHKAGPTSFAGAPSSTRPILRTALQSLPMEGEMWPAPEPSRTRPAAEQGNGL